jgi:hypothetical protein
MKSKTLGSQSQLTCSSYLCEGLPLSLEIPTLIELKTGYWAADCETTSRGLSSAVHPRARDGGLFRINSGVRELL